MTYLQQQKKGENEVNQTREHLIYYNEFACAFFYFFFVANIFTFIMLSLNSLSKVYLQAYIYIRNEKQYYRRKKEREKNC